MSYPRPLLAGTLLSAMVVVLLAAALPPPAQAQIRRCTAADGGTVYTDRSCAAMGAVETRPAAAQSPGSPARYRGGCSRQLRDLVFEVTAAIDARDTNRLARSYHWPGMSTRGGYAVIERLDAIAHRPLLNISALRPAQPVHVPAPTSTSGWSQGPPAGTAGAPRQPTPGAMDGASAAPGPGPAPVSTPATGPVESRPFTTGQPSMPPLPPSAGVTAARTAPAPPAAQRRPVALRIDQALADGITPSTTTFGLRRHMDCWWITL